MFSWKCSLCHDLNAIPLLMGEKQGQEPFSIGAHRTCHSALDGQHSRPSPVTRPSSSQIGLQHILCEQDRSQDAGMAAQLWWNNISVHFFMKLRLGDVPIEELRDPMADHGK
jgi:hypothetical protein